MLASLIETVAGAYEPARHRELLNRLWEMEVWFDTPHQRKAAEACREILESAGLSGVRLAPYPCDGKTRLQDWITHLAWDCPAARLAFADGGVLADREPVPASVVYWSGPLASKAAPAVGGVVDGDALGDVTAEAVAGEYVLTAKPPLEMKRRLLGFEPLAVVSDYLGEGRGLTDETVKWCNTWSDGPEGWYIHADDSVMCGFCISPAKGRLLRQRMAAEPGLQLAGFCDARLYAGEGQNVTAVLPGTDRSREVWLYGHACEQGAHDNTSGVTVLIESLRILKGLVDAGTLPPPRDSIRIITTEECIGMAAFATLQDDLRRAALVGFNVDGAGDPATPEHPFLVHVGPLSSPTFGWPVAGLLAEALQAQARGQWAARTRPFVPTADDMIGDPNCGVPSMWLGKGGTSLGYHSSADTPEVCSDDSLRNNTLLAAAWAYVMAAMDDSAAGQLIGPAAGWVEANLLQDGEDDAAALRGWAAGGVLRDLGRWGVSRTLFEPAASRFAESGAPPLPDLPADGPVYKRTVWGTCTYETLPVPRRGGLSRWSEAAAAGLYWTDGRRPLAAVERLARAETGTLPEGGLGRVMEGGLEAGTLVQVHS
jgi:hypothetical protein